jgi:[CysO sulfur-carrier protein]-S-L-cysteine hydrolase
MSGLFTPQDLLNKIIAHCRSVYPHEACGLLAGKGRVVEKSYEMTNLDHSNVSYLMDPAEQFKAMKEMRQEGRDMVAIYHSHPHSGAQPSAKDVELAFYPDSVYMIVGLLAEERPEIRAFEIIDSEVREIEIVSVHLRVKPTPSPLPSGE